MLNLIGESQPTMGQAFKSQFGNQRRCRFRNLEAAICLQPALMGITGHLSLLRKTSESQFAKRNEVSPGNCSAQLDASKEVLE